MPINAHLEAKGQWRVTKDQEKAEESQTCFYDKHHDSDVKGGGMPTTYKEAPVSTSVIRP